MHLCRHCDREHATQLDLVEHQLGVLIDQGVRTMGALENLKDADAALKTTVTTFLTDIAGRLEGHDDPEIQAVADDINAEVASIQGSDPGPLPTDGGATPPADGTPVDGSQEPAPAE